MAQRRWGDCVDDDFVERDFHSFAGVPARSNRDRIIPRGSTYGERASLNFGDADRQCLLNGRAGRGPRVDHSHIDRICSRVPEGVRHRCHAADKLRRSRVAPIDDVAHDIGGRSIRVQSKRTSLPADSGESVR